MTDDDEATATKTLQHLSDEISAGGVVGALQCTAALRDAQHVVGELAGTDMYKKSWLAVTQEWDKQVDACMNKIDFERLGSIASKYTAAYDAVEQWCFEDENLQWMHSAEPDPPRLADYKFAESCVTSLPTCVRAASEIAAAVGECNWVDSGKAEKINSFAAKAAPAGEGGKITSDVAVKLSAVLLANAILAHPQSIDVSKTYVQQKMRVSLSCLPKQLRKNLEVALATNSKCDKKAADAAAADDSKAKVATTAAASHMPPAAEMPKMRRLHLQT